jgi:hypothetical protein
MTVAGMDESAALVERLRQGGRHLVEEIPDHQEYIQLQGTWDAPILQYAARWMPVREACVCSIALAAMRPSGIRERS